MGFLRVSEVWHHPPLLGSKAQHPVKSLACPDAGAAFPTSVLEQPQDTRALRGSSFQRRPPAGSQTSPGSVQLAQAAVLCTHRIC